MATNSEWFLQQSQLAFERKRAQYETILQAILSQELKTPGQRKAELDLLAREETTLRTMEDGLRKTQREQVKSDYELLGALTKGQTDIAKANIDFNKAVRVATIGSQTDLAIAKARAEAQIDEDASRERAKSSELASAALTEAGSFGPGVFSATDPKSVSDTAVGYLKGLWAQAFESKMKAATTPSQRQAVVDSFKRASSEWLSKQQPGTSINTILSSDVVASSAVSKTLQDLRVADAGMTSDDMIAQEVATKKAGISIPSSTGNGSTRGVDENILLTRRERAQALLGLDKEALGADQLAIDLADGRTPAYEKYLLGAAYNRMHLQDPEKADAFFTEFDSLDKFISAVEKNSADKPTISSEVQALIEDTELLDTSSLKTLHDGDYAKSMAELRTRRAALDEQKRKLMDGSDESQTIEDAINKARYLTRKLHGDAKTQTGISSAETIYKELQGKSPEEQQAIIDQLPLDTRGKQVALKAASGAPITDKELRTLDMNNQSPVHLPEAMVAKFNERLPGFISTDGKVVVSYDEKGTAFLKDADELSIPEFGEALSNYKGGPDGGHTIDPETARKLKESMRLLGELTKSQPYLAPYITHLTATQLDKVLGPADVKIKAGPIRLPKNKRDLPPEDEGMGDGASNSRSFNDATILRLGATNKVAPDVVAQASTVVKEKLGRAPSSQQLTQGIDTQLNGFSKAERSQLTELAKQSSRATPSQIQSNISKIINPLVDPDKYQQAISFVGIVSNPQVSDLYHQTDNLKIKRELAALKA